MSPTIIRQWSEQTTLKYSVHGFGTSSEVTQETQAIKVPIGTTARSNTLSTAQ